MVGLGAGDLSAAQTAGAHALDALGAEARGTLHGLLHGPAEGDTLLQLGGDVLGHQLRVQVGAADLDDVQSDLLAVAELVLDGLTQLLDLLAALADDDAGAGDVEVDLDLRVVALDLDLGDAGGVQGLLQVLSDVVVFHEEVADLLGTGIPAGIPILDDADTQSVGVNFLSHYCTSCLSPARSRRW